MSVTPLAGNQAGKGMVALLGAPGRALGQKPPIKGVDGDNGNVLESAFPGLNRRIMTQLVFFWLVPTTLVLHLGCPGPTHFLGPDSPLGS